MKFRIKKRNWQSHNSLAGACSVLLVLFAGRASIAQQSAPVKPAIAGIAGKPAQRHGLREMSDGGFDEGSGLFYIGTSPIGVAHSVAFNLIPAAGTALEFNATTPVEFFTDGAPGGDLAKLPPEAGDVPCAGTLQVNMKCTLRFNFTPSSAGQRLGALVFLGPNGAEFYTEYVHGIGQGPQVAFDPGVPALLDPTSLRWGVDGVQGPEHILVDGADNFYVSSGDGLVKFDRGGNFSPAVGGTKGIVSMALDPDGDIDIVTVGDGGTSAESLSVVFDGKDYITSVNDLDDVRGMAIDDSGHLFLSQFGANNVLKSAVGGFEILPVPRIAGLALKGPTAIAVDAEENVYIADSGNRRIVKVPASGTPTVLVGAERVTQIALGGNGDLYFSQIAQGGSDSAIFKLTPAGAFTAILRNEVRGSALSPTDMAVDGSGNLFIANNQKNVLLISRTSESLAFGNVPVGASADANDALAFTLENIGNEALEFSVQGKTKIGLAHNAYTLPANYTLAALPLDAGVPQNYCPVTYLPLAKDPSYTLAADATCGMAVVFEPAAGGQDFGNMVIADYGLNTPAHEQTVLLTGNGTTTAVQILFNGCSKGAHPVCAAVFDGKDIPVTVTTVPAGIPVSITYYQLGGGVVNEPLLVGTYTVVATVTSPAYSGSVTGTLTIEKAGTVVTWASPIHVAPGTPLSAAQLNATGSVPGTIAYSYAQNYPNVPPLAIGAVLPTGSYNAVATLTPLGSASYRPSAATATLIVGQPTWTPSPLNFGTVIVGTVSSELSLVLTNNTNGNLNCNSYTFSSAGKPIANINSIGLAFYSFSGIIAFPTALPPGESCTYSFEYTPTQTGNLAVTMTVAGVSAPVTLLATAVSPPITVTPDPSVGVNFGTIQVGQSAKAQVTVKNNTNTILSGITETLTNNEIPAQIVLGTSTTCNGTLAPNASCQYTFVYTPTTPGGAGATLNIAVPYMYSINFGPQTIWPVSEQLSGGSLTPAMPGFLQAPPNPLLVEQGSSGYPGFELTDLGGEPLTGISIPQTLSGNYLTGTGAKAFVQGTWNCLTYTTLAEDQQCVMSWELPNTTLPGVYNATWTVDTAVGPFVTQINAIVYAIPSITPSTSGSTFDLVPLNTASAPLKVTVSNPTAGPLTITSAPIVASPTSDLTAAQAAAEFKITSTTCNAAVASMGSCVYNVVFTPINEDEVLAQLEVNTSFTAPAPAPAQTLQLNSSFDAYAKPVAVIVATPTTPLNFGTQTVGTVGTVQTATIANTAINSDVTLSAPVLTGPGAEDFKVTVTCDTGTFTTAGAGTLPGGNGAACSYQIIFAPVASSPVNVNVTMTVKTNAPTGNVVFNPTGTAPQVFTGRVVWIPDFEGQLLQVRAGTGATAKAITLQLSTTCNPTSVTASLSYAFVFCSSSAGNKDELLIYDANFIRDSAAGTIAPTPLETWTVGPSDLFGAGFGTSGMDASGNLWFSGLQGVGGAPSLFYIPASQISSGALQSDGGGVKNPIILSSFNLSGPGSSVLHDIYPNQITFAPDGSLWISGSEYTTRGGTLTGPVAGNIYGILLNIPANQLNPGGSGPAAFTCLTPDPLAPLCTSYTGDFNDPGGVAILGDTLWVSVTGASQFGVTTAKPGREIIGFPLTSATTGDTLGTAVPFGSATTPAASPFVCPGSLFAQASNPVHLWIDDDGYGDSTQSPTCGETGDTASKIGGVFDYTPTQLSNHTATLSEILAYTNVTGRPGPEGLFVENDQ